MKGVICIVGVSAILSLYATASSIHREDAIIRALDDIIYERILYKFQTRNNHQLIEYLGRVLECATVGHCYCDFKKVTSKLNPVPMTSSSYCGILQATRLQGSSSVSWDIQVPIKFALMVIFHRLNLLRSRNCTIVKVTLQNENKQEHFCGKHGTANRELPSSSARIEIHNILTSEMSTDVLVSYQIKSKVQTTNTARISQSLFHTSTRDQLEHTLIIMAEAHQFVRFFSRRLRRIDILLNMNIRDGPSKASPLTVRDSTAFVLFVHLMLKSPFTNVTDYVTYKLLTHNIHSVKNKGRCYPVFHNMTSFKRKGLITHENNFRKHQVSAYSEPRSHTNNLCLWHFNSLRLNEYFQVDKLQFYGPDVLFHENPNSCQFGGLFLYKFHITEDYVNVGKYRSTRLRHFGSLCGDEENKAFYNFKEITRNFGRNEGLLVLVVWFASLSFGEIQARYV